jgi:hypothetical protein
MIKISNIPAELGTRQGVRSILDTYRRFPSLYSSWEDLFLHHLGNSDCEWHKGNIRMAVGPYRDHIVKDYPFKISVEASIEVLEHDVEYLHNDLTNSVYPIPAQTIPDDITPFWFHVTDMVCYKVERLYPKDFYKFRYYRYKAINQYWLKYVRINAGRQISELKTAQKVIKTVIKPRLNEIRVKRGDSFLREAYKAGEEFHNFVFYKTKNK